MSRPFIAVPNRWSSMPWVGAFIFGALITTAGGLCLSYAIQYAFRGHLAEAGVLGSASCVVGLLLVSCAYTYILARRTDPGPAGMATGNSSVRIVESRRYISIQILLAILAPLTGFAYSVGSWTGQVDFPVPAGQQSPYVIGTFISSSILAVALLRFAVRGRTVELELTPESISYNSWVSNQTVPWSSVTGLSINSPASRQLSFPRCQVNLRTEGRRQPMQITANTFDMGASAVYWLVKYYFEHPEDRDELGDQRAIDRLMSGRVVTNRKNHL